MRGTKNPDIAKIIGLHADLVVCNQEENRKIDVDRLRAAGVTVWVTRIETLDEAFTALDRLFGVALRVDSPAWLDEARALWTGPGSAVPNTVRTAAIPIWRDPWMVIGGHTFADDLLKHMQIENVFGDPADRYPHVSVQEIVVRRPDIVILPDEPYPFAVSDGPEAFASAADGRPIDVVFVSGRHLTWYGPSLVEAHQTLAAQLQR